MHDPNNQYQGGRLLLRDVNRLAELMGGQQANEEDFAQVCATLGSEESSFDDSFSPTASSSSSSSSSSASSLAATNDELGLTYPQFKKLVVSASVEQLLSIQASLKVISVDNGDDATDKDGLGGEGTRRTLLLTTEEGEEDGTMQLVPTSPKSPKSLTGPPPEPTDEDEEKDALIELGRRYVHSLETNLEPTRFLH